jgi:glycosyltransferase involved in cell wall biosynthesis
MSEYDVILVGPVAPPRGGVATHVERLAELLDGESLRVGILDHFGNTMHQRVIGTLKRNPVRYWWYMRRLRASVVHYHHSRFSTLVAAALARRSPNGTWVASIHGHEIERSLNSRLPGVRRMGRWAIGRFDRLIAVSVTLAETLAQPDGPDVTIIPAYIPPAESHNEDSTRLSEPTVVLSAYRVAPVSSRDVYGLDFGGVVLARASAECPDLRCEIFLAQAPSRRAARRYLQRALRPLRDQASEDRVVVRVGADLSKAFRPGAIYVRPTRTDGDAVSIREALDSAVPVIASDVVARPPGVISLPLDDTEAWVDAIRGAVSLPLPQRPPRQHASTTTDAMLAFYRDMLGSVMAPSPGAGTSGAESPRAKRNYRVAYSGLNAEQDS